MSAINDYIIGELQFANLYFIIVGIIILTFITKDMEYKSNLRQIIIYSTILAIAITIFGIMRVNCSPDQIMKPILFIYFLLILVILFINLTYFTTAECGFVKEGWKYTFVKVSTVTMITVSSLMVITDVVSQGHKLSTYLKSGASGFETF
jgi:hypothetical protein